MDVLLWLKRLMKWLGVLFGIITKTKQLIDEEKESEKKEDKKK